MLSQNLKREWVSALRSGQFLQTTGFLRQEHEDGPRYCCLGVLAESLDHTRTLSCWVDNGVLPYDPDYHDVVVNGCSEGDLPGWVLDYVGLTEDEQADLIKMNDGVKLVNKDGHVEPDIYVKDRKPKSFDEIADWIEENL